MKKYLLAPYVRVGIQNEVFFLGFGSILKKITDKELHVPIASFLKALKIPKTLEEIKKEWGNYAINVSSAKKEIFIKNFIEGNYLIREDEYSSQERNSRNHLYYRLNGKIPFEAEDLLKSKHVLILGCGGIGNAISYLLTAAGIGSLTLMDQDIIEASNLTRQFLFKEEDVGKDKITILKKELSARNKQIRIDTFNKQIQTFKDLCEIPENIDLLILSADKPSSIIFWVNKFCIEKRIPYINVGYVEDIAVWGPFVIPGKTACFECQPLVSTFVLPEGINLNDINKGYQAPSFGPINMLAASLATLDIVRFLGQFGTVQSLNNRLGLWTHDLRIEKQKCALNRNCDRCSHLFQRS